MMASASGAAPSPYVPVAAHELRRQTSVPAALAAAFTPCGSHDWPRDCLEDGGAAELRGRSPRPALGAVVRALWAWVGRRKKAVISRSRSSAKEQRYGHEEYAQNFDDGGAAREPDNLPRSFSARYARRRAPSPWDGAR